MEGCQQINNLDANNSCMNLEEKDGSHLERVACYQSGEGLPYAPVDWPNPGDIWTWKVGKRVKQSGYFQDRYLIAPKRLQETPNKKMWFLSKISLKSYVKTNFPEADVDAFFSSFVWEIPGSPSSEGKAEVKPHSRSPRPLKACKIGHGGGTSSQKWKSNLRQQGWQYLKKQVVPDILFIKEENLEYNGTPKEVETCLLESAPASEDNATITPLACQQESATSLREVTPEDFDNYVDSLDDLLTLPLHRSPSISYGSWEEKEMTDARKKLVSLLDIGFPALFTSDKLTQITALSLELQNDSNLSARELLMLKLIQEIPPASNDFLEAKRVTKEADNFFSDLEAKLGRVSTLRDEYNASKQEIALLEVEDVSTSTAIKEIDEKIAVLQSRRTAFVKVAERTSKKIAKVKSKQRKVMDHLPKIVDEVQLANSQSSEWKLKKQKSAEKEIAIMTKFASLKGFFF